MAGSSAVALNLGAPPTEKLTRGNYLLWKAQVMPALRGYLLNSLTPEILAQVIGKESTHDLWTALTTLFAAQSQSRITNLRIAISNTKKGNMSSNSFIAKMKSLGDELAAAGRPMTDGEMISAFDQRMEMLGDGPSDFCSFANAMYRGRGQSRARAVEGIEGPVVIVPLPLLLAVVEAAASMTTPTTAASTIA